MAAPSTTTDTTIKSHWDGDIIAEMSRVTCEEAMPLHWDEALTAASPASRDGAAVGQDSVLGQPDADMPF
ncbi:hypothetical protein N9917_00410 [Deltaproteobacteria bacterium]|nr:hypothetical protein [Deltaproteobacteria bacterium]